MGTIEQKGDQKIEKNSRIMCDNCSDFAKASLEGRHLCAGCLLGELMSSQEAGLFEKLSPLQKGTDSEPPRA